MSIDEFIDLIKKSSQHTCLYHFTDESNFDQIKKHGLLSKERMRAQGWWPKNTGGNALSHQQDKVRGISSYVSLCLTCNHPMKYLAHRDGRLPNPRYLKICPDILRCSGVKIAFGVANANDTEIVLLPAALDHLDIEVIYMRTDWLDPDVNARLRRAEKMEVLVPNVIERRFIFGVV